MPIEWAIILAVAVSDAILLAETSFLPLPRWDEALATVDRALGLNWLDMYQWLTRHPAIEASAHAAYNNRKVFDSAMRPRSL
jgi:hypothetical protein